MNKDQFVIACVESAESAAIVLPWARHFAECLNHKGLMVLHVSTTATDDSWLKELGVPFVSMRGDWRTAIEGIPTAFNGILAVAAVNPAAPRTSLTHPKKLLHEFKNCKTAYLVVSGMSEVGSRRSDTTMLTMTHRRGGKEKLVWASYLARFLGSRITIAHPDYRDGDLRMRWKNNMRFVDKMFTPLGITYTDAVAYGTSTSCSPTCSSPAPPTPANATSSTCYPLYPNTVFSSTLRTHPSFSSTRATTCIYCATEE